MAVEEEEHAGGGVGAACGGGEAVNCGEVREGGGREEAIMNELPVNGVHGGEVKRGEVICFGSFAAVLEAGSNGSGRGGKGGGDEEVGREDVENWQGSGGKTPGRAAQGGVQCGNEKQRRRSESAFGKQGNGEWQEVGNGVLGSRKSSRGKDAGNEVNKVEGIGAEIQRRPKEKRDLCKQAGRDGNSEVKILSQKSLVTDIERSLSLQTSAMNANSTGSRPAVVERERENQKSGQEANGSGLLGEARSGERGNGHCEPGSVQSHSKNNQSAEEDSNLPEPGQEEDRRAVAGGEIVKEQEISRPLPPVLSSADQRSIRLAWVGCPTAVSYYLDTACNDVATTSKKVAVSTVHNPAIPPASTGREPDLKWTSVYCGKERSYKVDHLKPGTTYSFRIRVVPIVVPPLAPPPSPPPSDTAVFSTLPAAPSAPPAPTLVNRARTSLKVKWSAPSESGGLPISEYMLDMSPPPGKGDADVAFPPTSDGFMRVYSGRETALKVTRLLPGTMYRFRVLAVNSVGQSEYSKEASYTTDASVPAAPLAPTLVSASPTSMTVEWQEPHNCGSPVTDYTLERDDGEGGPFVTVYRGENLHYIMEGLKSGHVYRVRVMAHNDKGKGASSVPAELLTGFSTPNPPPPPTITGRSTNSVIITWCCPESDGGSPVTAYEVELRAGSSRGQGPEVAAAWTLIYYGLANTHTSTGLSPGHQYRVRVRAVNLMGKSGFSGEALFSTSPGPPEAPSAPTALESGSSKLTLGWRPPAHDGGSSITAFRLEINALDRNGWGKDTSTTGRAEHEEGKGFVTVYRGDESRSVVEGLQPGANYCFRVQALNRLGAGPYSEISILKTFPAPPSAPEPPVIVGSPAATVLSVRWYPSESNGAPIQSYQVQMLVLGYGEKCVPSCDDAFCSDEYGPHGENSSKHLDATSLAGQGGHSDLSSSYSYGVPHSPSHSVSSASSRGTSAWESEKSLQKDRPPLSNTGTSEDESDLQEIFPKGGNEKSVIASHPDSSGSTMNGCQNNLSLHDIYDGSSTTYTISNLQPFTSYAFRVQARNGAGSSGFSSFVIGMTSSAAPCAPCPPTALEATSSSLTLRWEIPERDNGSPVYRYSLQMAKVGSDKESLPLKDRNNIALNSGKKSSNKRAGKQDAVNSSGSPTSVWDQIYDGDALQYEVLDLLAGHQYRFRVVAHNEMGASPPSACAEVTTLPSAPRAPQSPIFSSITPTSVRIRWLAPTCDNGMPVTSYKLTMDDGKGGRLRKVYEGGATSHKAIKLVPASCYCAAVQAINALGASALSEVATVKLPVAPPHTPSIPKVMTMTENSVAIHWLPKEHDGSQAVMDSIRHNEGVANAVSFSVEMEDLSMGGKYMQVYEGSSTSFEVRNLAADHKYRFRVRANGAPGAGLSSWSAWSTSVTVARRASTSHARAKPSFQKELTTSITTIAQIATQLRHPWSLQTRRWLAVAGIALTLSSALYTGLS